MYDYEQVMTFDDLSAYQSTASSSAAVDTQQQTVPVKKKKSIKSETSIELRGPMEVDGSVKSMGAVADSLYRRRRP